MIVPTRFGLKYAPIPTLALEYEDDSNDAVDAMAKSGTSLYVYRENDRAFDSRLFRKLHVIEFPTLTRTSKTQQITRQLQHDNSRYLAPEVVSGDQVKRLLDRLVQNLPDSTLEQIKKSERMAIAHKIESGLEVEVCENHNEDIAKADSLESNEIEMLTAHVPPIDLIRSPENDRDDEGGRKAGEATPLEDLNIGDNSFIAGQKTANVESEDKAEDDAKKTTALQCESDVSDEEVESEELEYFSEDGSDEDSF